MKLYVSLIDDCVVLHPRGKIMGDRDRQHIMRCIDLFITHQHSKFIVDFSGVDWTASDGFKALLPGYIQLRRKGGEIKLAHLNEKVESLWKIMRFDSLFTRLPVHVENDPAFPVVDKESTPLFSSDFDYEKFVQEQRELSTLVHFLFTLDRDRIRIIPCHSGGLYRISDPSRLGSEPLIALPSSLAKATGMFWKEEVEEFEDLLNRRSAKEIEFHRFFERHPKFLIGSDYDKLHSGIVLSRDSDSLIPDFLLEPYWSREACDILELKLPCEKLVSGRANRRGFSSALVRALYQLREYRDYFDNEARRRAIMKRYGVSAYKPKLCLVVGRSRYLDPLERAKAEADFPQLRVFTYDDLLERAKHRLLT